MLPAHIVLQIHSNLNFLSKMPTLAVKLVKESFFGDDAMIGFTVQGCREQPPLTLESLAQLITLFLMLVDYF